jgi:CHASE3 domain sensor protein
MNSAPVVRKESAMEWSLEKRPWVSLLLGGVLLFAWGVMSFANAYDRSLTKVDDSVTRGFMLVEQLSAVLDVLGRLNVDQQAFLSTGDARFQDGVVESAETLTLRIGGLNAHAARNNLHSPLLAGLSHSLDLVLASVGESDKIRASRGRAAALAYFESTQDVISEARWQADRLKEEIAGSVSDRIRSARATGALFQGLLDSAPSGTRLKRGA